MTSLGTVILMIVVFTIPVSILYIVLWVYIETTAKFLVGIIVATSILYVGYDLLITVFSYGTWAVFFKKLLGSIIIVLPISYVLYWLEQIKKRKKIFKKLTSESQSVKSIFKNPLEMNMEIVSVLVAVALSFIIPIFLMIIFNKYSIIFNGIALLIFFIGYGFYLPFKEKKELVEAKNIEYKRLLSLGWSKEIATRRAFGENSLENLANPLKKVQMNVNENLEQREDVRANHLTEELEWEYGINNKDSTSNFKLETSKVFTRLTNIKQYTLKSIVFIVLIAMLVASGLIISSSTEFQTDTDTYD